MHPDVGVAEAEAAARQAASGANARLRALKHTRRPFAQGESVIEDATEEILADRRVVGSAACFGVMYAHI